MESNYVYISILEDRENSEIYTDVFLNEDLAWKDILKNAKDTYGFDPNDEKSKKRIGDDIDWCEGWYLNMCTEQAFYEVREQRILKEL